MFYGYNPNMVRGNNIGKNRGVLPHFGNGYVSDPVAAAVCRMLSKVVVDVLWMFHSGGSGSCRTPGSSLRRWQQRMTNSLLALCQRPQPTPTGDSTPLNRSTRVACSASIPSNHVGYSMHTVEDMPHPSVQRHSVI